VRSRSAERKATLPLCTHVRGSARPFCNALMRGGWLGGQGHVQRIQHGLDVFLRLGVARQYRRPSTIGIQTPTSGSLPAFSGTAAGVSPGACSSRRFFESHLQAVTQASDQNVSIRPRFELVIDGPDGQFTLQPLMPRGTQGEPKHTLDLRELHRGWTSFGTSPCRRAARQKVPQPFTCYLERGGRENR
jgi:hypothetical protein